MVEGTGEFELRQLLHWRWDPIGIAGAFPAAADEYDSYPPGIVSALRQGASSREIAELLTRIEQDQMGFDKRADVGRESVALDILAWFEQSQHQWTNFGALRR